MQNLDEIIGGSDASAPAKFKRMSVTMSIDATTTTTKTHKSPSVSTHSHFGKRSSKNTTGTRVSCFNNRPVHEIQMVAAQDCFNRGSCTSALTSTARSLEANAEAVADLFGGWINDNNDNSNNDNDNNDDDDDDESTTSRGKKMFGFKDSKESEGTSDKKPKPDNGIRREANKKMLSIQALKSTKEILQRRLKKIDSKFFKDNPIRRLPRFIPDELKLGDHLGAGEFGDVYEIESIVRKPASVRMSEFAVILEDNQSDIDSDNEVVESKLQDDASQGPATASLTLPIPSDLLVGTGNLDVYLRRRIESLKEQENDGVTPNMFDKNIQPNNKSNWNNCLNENDSNRETGDSNEAISNYTPRRRHGLNVHDTKGQMINRQKNSPNFEGYAIKVVRDDIATERKKRVAAADMATEAKILSALSHPNIIRIRGIMGYIERPGKYGIIMDKLQATLQDQIEIWAEVASSDKIPLGFPPRNSILGSVSKWMTSRQDIKSIRMQHLRQVEFYMQRLEAAMSVAQALKYLHGKKIVFRDLKPENVGITNANYVLFDFGLSRYLTDSHRVVGNSNDQYRATGLTGSRLFMAPEVARNKPYGFSADTFSFAMLFWEVMSLEEVFPLLSLNKHFRVVIVKGIRPTSIEHILTPELNMMMEGSWADDPRKRPLFDSICETLTRHIRKLELCFRYNSSVLRSFQTYFNAETLVEDFSKRYINFDHDAIHNKNDHDEENTCRSNRDSREKKVPKRSPRSIFRKMHSSRNDSKKNCSSNRPRWLHLKTIFKKFKSR